MDRVILTRIKDFIGRRREVIMDSQSSGTSNGSESSSQYSPASTMTMSIERQDDDHDDSRGNLAWSDPPSPPSTDNEIDLKHVPFIPPSPPMSPSTLNYYEYLTQLQKSRIKDLEKDRTLLAAQLSNHEKEFEQREQKWRVEHEVNKKIVMAELKLLLLNRNTEGAYAGHLELELKKKEMECSELKGKMLAADMVLDEVLNEKRRDEKLIKDLQDEVTTLKKRAEENGINFKIFKNEMELKNQRIDKLEEEVVTLKRLLESSQQKKKTSFADIRRILDGDECEEGEKIPVTVTVKSQTKKEKVEAMSQSGNGKGAETTIAMTLLQNKSYRPAEANMKPSPKMKDPKIGKFAGATEATVNNLQLVPFVNQSAGAHTKLKCDECPKTFYHRLTLQAHTRKIHLQGSGGVGRCNEIDNMKVFKSGLKLNSKGKKPKPTGDSNSSNITGNVVKLKLMKEDQDETQLSTGSFGSELMPIRMGRSSKSNDLVFLSGDSPARPRRKGQPVQQRNKFKCKRCPKRFYSFCEWRVHMEKVHKSTMLGGAVGCSLCGKAFNTRKQFNQHRKEFHHHLNSKLKMKVRRAEDVLRFMPD